MDLAAIRLAEIAQFTSLPITFTCASGGNWLERNEIIGRIVQDSNGLCQIAPNGPHWSPMKSFAGFYFDSSETALATFVAKVTSRARDVRCEFKADVPWFHARVNDRGHSSRRQDRPPF
jgi:hypothetical protein